MRYLILSDMHANRHALEAVLADASVMARTRRRSLIARSP
jgi:hypothetical protein